MSSCDAFMIASAGLFTENIYRPLSPDKPQRHYVTVGRIAAVVVVSGGVVFAFWLPGVVAGLEIFWKVSAMMGLAFWMGFARRRGWTGNILEGFGDDGSCLLDGFVLETDNCGRSVGNDPGQFCSFAVHE